LYGHCQQIGSGGGLEQLAGDAAGGVAGAEVQPLAAGAQLREKGADVLSGLAAGTSSSNPALPTVLTGSKSFTGVVGQLPEHRRVGRRAWCWSSGARCSPSGAAAAAACAAMNPRRQGGCRR
jgi:hypothetical protein